MLNTGGQVVNIYQSPNRIKIFYFDGYIRRMFNFVKTYNYIFFLIDKVNSLNKLQ